MYTIATLDDLRRRLGLGSAETDADQDLLRALQDASHLIESLTQRRYCPRLETLTTAQDSRDLSQLILPDDLLELQALRDAGHAIDLDDVQLLPGDEDAPSSVLQLVNGRIFQAGEDGARYIAITGLWGWHDRWGQAWRISGDAIQSGSLSPGATTISVSDIAGSDASGFGPRFQVGQLLRIKQEYLRVTAVDGQNQRLTVLRGAQGSLASAHAIGTAIELYTPSLPIRNLTLRYAELMLKSQSLPAESPSALLERMRRLNA